jgi:FAD/FMN-containing dehydrogenase
MAISWIRDPAVLEGYAEDVSGLVGNPEALARPTTAEDVAEIVSECRATKTFLTPVGLRSSTTGSSVALKGAVISLEKMDRILDIDPSRRIARVQPGINLAAFKKEVAAAGLFYPPDPTSEPDCCIGGTVATNASGSRTYRYGSTRHWIRELKLVLGTGEPITVSRSVSFKNTTGYIGFQNPVDLFVGSEGTLGVVTEVTVDLLPAPESFYGAMAFFPDLDSAIRFVLHADAHPELTPRCLELFDASCLDLIRPYAERLTIPGGAGSAIFFEVEVPAESGAVVKNLETWLGHLEKHGAMADETMIAETRERQEELRSLRHRVPETCNEMSRSYRPAGGRKISTDWAVPLAALPDVMRMATAVVTDDFGGTFYRYGHVGNGHPHFNLMAEDSEALKRAEKAVHEICRRVVAMGGTVTAEHGVGKVKRPFLSYQFPAPILQAMQAVKRSFDPGGILAPGNIFPDTEITP